MNTIKSIARVLVLLIVLVTVNSCKKPPGPGGKATIKGKVYAYDYDNTQQYMVSEGFSAGETVYIMYGDDNTVGGNVKTSPDGSFEFKYLNKGKYKVFVNSLDISIHVKGNDTEIPLIKEVEITGTSQTLDLGKIEINK